LKNSRTVLLIFAVVLTIAIGAESMACTSFKLETDQGLYFVHSLNQGSIPGLPGLIFINQRQTWKQGYSWETLITVNNNSGPDLVWKSTFGSVTFNPFGKELPDGGINEAGLYIWEMGFDTEYSADESKPTLFQAQWMQYVLDNFSTIEEVIANAGQLNLDGWGWHYFIADKSGATAIIDFVGGKPIIYSGENMPIPLCCNSVYPEAIHWLKQHQGFGGELKIEKVHQEIPRFIYGAKLLQEHDTQDPVDYSFYVLDEMSENVRWSVVFDVAGMKVYYKTNLNQDIRHFSFSPADFGKPEGPLILDIEDPGTGNLRQQFTPYNRETDRQLLTSVFGLVCETEPAFRKVLLEDQGVKLETLVENIMNKLRLADPITTYDLRGAWTGKVIYPAGDEWIELATSLVLTKQDDQLFGKMNDDELIKNLPLTNIINHGGLFQFTIKHPDTGDILDYQMYSTGNRLRGTIEICGKTKQGKIDLTRNDHVGK